MKLVRNAKGRSLYCYAWWTTSELAVPGDLLEGCRWTGARSNCAWDSRYFLSFPCDTNPVTAWRLVNLIVNVDNLHAGDFFLNRWQIGVHREQIMSTVCLALQLMNMIEISSGRFFYVRRSSRLCLVTLQLERTNFARFICVVRLL